VSAERLFVQPINRLLIALPRGQLSARWRHGVVNRELLRSIRRGVPAIDWEMTRRRMAAALRVLQHKMGNRE
jgi:hypothetical protein